MANKHSSLIQKIFILLAKLKRPLIRKLMSLKKMKKLKLLEHRSYYSYVKEYEFSPSSTPLIQFRRMSRISLTKLYSNLLIICKDFLGIRNKEIYRLEMGLNSLVCAEEEEEIIVGESEDDDCVDERAERFIQSFYEEMRRQRNESNLQLLLQN